MGIVPLKASNATPLQGLKGSLLHDCYHTYAPLGLVIVP
jgi:hypothetical protein